MTELKTWGDWAHYETYDVVSDTGVVIGGVRCADDKRAQTETSPWLAFRNHLDRDREPIGQYPTKAAAVAAVEAYQAE